MRAAKAIGPPKPNVPRRRKYKTNSGKVTFEGITGGTSVADSACWFKCVPVICFEASSLPVGRVQRGNQWRASLRGRGPSSGEKSRSAGCPAYDGGWQRHSSRANARPSAQG